MLDRPVSANKLVWFLLSTVMAITLSLTGAWALSVNDGNKELRGKDAEIEQQVNTMKTDFAVQQVQLRTIEEKLDRALGKLDKLTEKR